jgi:hypothetical protein
MTNTSRIVTMSQIAAVAGHMPGNDGKLVLPTSQAVADALAEAARRIVLDGAAEWMPGAPPVGDVTLTGAGPVWAYLAVAHGLHGVVRSLTYASPQADIRVWNHDAAD